MDLIDLDQNATSPLDPEVLEAMRPHWLAGGNPESRHALGRRARQALERARETIAQRLGATSARVVFTSGGTEANNLAILGLIGDDPAGAHIVTSQIEHPAVSEPIALLARHGAEVSPMKVRITGIIDVSSFDFVNQPRTRLATLMLANNETGARQPVAALCELTARWGTPVHTDAVQAVGRIEVDFDDLGVATLAASAHKFHGPSGIGVLIARKGVKLAPQLLGGGQQSGTRPGTPTVALAVGMAAALERWHLESGARVARWGILAKQLEDGLTQALGVENVVCHGPKDDSLRLPQTRNIGFPRLDGNALLMQLDLLGVCASLGAACASGSTQPSPTLVAMGVPQDLLRSSVRFSFGAGTTEPEIDEAVRRVAEAVRRIKGTALDS
jgi:cysteine desulfurase